MVRSFSPPVATRVRSNAMTARTSRAASAVNTRGSRCAGAEFFRSDRPARSPRDSGGSCRGNGVQNCAIGADEERVEAPHVERGVLAGGAVRLGVEIGDPAHQEPVGRPVVRPLSRIEAVNATSASRGHRDAIARDGVVYPMVAQITC